MGAAFARELPSENSTMKRLTIFILILTPSLFAVPCAAVAGGKADRIHQQGLKALSRGENDQAVELISRAIAVDPTEHRYYNDRGVAFKRAGNLDRAVADYTKALEIKPDFANALNNRGVAHIERGNFEKAIEDFAGALEYGGFKSKIYTNQGLAYAMAGKHPEAVENFRKAVSYRPLDYRSFLMMGRSLVRMGRKEDALKMYQLAQGLVKDAKIVDLLEARITRLELSLDRPKPVPTNPVTSGSGSKEPPGNTENLLPEPSPDSVRALDEITRRRALASFSPAAMEIYKRGREFQEKSDTRKALVRYEDALHLEKRNRNIRSAAWSLLEIGRVRASLGTQLRAIPNFKKALRIFNRLGASDEQILTMAELASAYSAVGLNQKAAGFYSRAREAAVSQGHMKLAARLGKMQLAAASKPNRRDAKPGPPKNSRHVKGDDQPEPGQRSAHLNRIGRGPVDWDKSSKKKKMATAMETLATRKAAAVNPRPEPTKTQPPVREVFWIKGAEPAEITIKEYLGQLKKFRAAGDEINMIHVLDLLAGRYAKLKKYDGVVHCLTASLALREKLGLKKGLAALLIKSGLVKDKVGRSAEALEDFTRAVSLSGNGKAGLRKSIHGKAIRTANRMGLDSRSALAALKALWKARASGNERDETRAFYRLARLYEKAGRPTDAVKYYRKSAASMAVQEAELLKKIGRKEQAVRTLGQAMGAFKKLDYSRYLRMIEKSKKRDTLSRRR